MTPFMTEDFIRYRICSPPVPRLRKRSMIFDYHCHFRRNRLPKITVQKACDIWLKGDHYKWRAMRTNGVARRLCTGDATDRARSLTCWAAVPHTIGNPLYHWTHLELRRPLVSPASCSLPPRRMRSGISATNCWRRIASRRAASCNR